MPHDGRTPGNRRVSNPFVRLTRLPALLGGSALASLWAGVAAAQTGPGNTSFSSLLSMISLDTFEVVQLALFTGAMAAAIGSALWLIRERGRTASQNLALRGKVSALTGRLSQLETLAASEGQRAIVWSDEPNKPAAVIGTLGARSGAPESRSEFLAFGRWLEPRSAARIEQAIARLRDHALPFDDLVQTPTGNPVEVTGRTSGGSAIVRFVSLSGERADHARLIADHARVVETLETLQGLMDQSDMPVWLRSADGALAWVNRAYADAVECADADAVVAERAELFGTQAGKTIAQQRQADGHFADQVSTVVRGDRLMFDVIDVAGPFGSAGIGRDRTETEAVRSELNTTIRSHEETLDQLTTAVAMFDSDARLRFHNQAFEQLWELDSGLLASKPDMSMFLDRMRAEGKLPEQPEWRRWKDGLLAAFKAVEPQEDWWYLPDGRTVRVIASPHPRGGLTWVFENLTERIDLESRYKTLMRVQGETLDHLAEGVAVFEADGTLQLANPAFERFWHIGHLTGEARVHINQIGEACAAKFGHAGPWEQFAGIVTGFDEDRAGATGRTETGSLTLSWTVVPLPNGQTMITFVDITASDQMERALRERNDALEKTALVRDRLIRHVSYELRAPLTSIGGFTELLEMDATGPLNGKQREYLDHIAASTGTLNDLTRDIIDLASVDAGVMELALDEVELEPVMRTAAAEIMPRLEDHGISLALRIAPDAGCIIADRARLTQVLTNILANAADYAPEDSEVVFTCERTEDGVRFRIRDHGPGIEEGALTEVFERFHTDQGGRGRGAGLGLAIVKSFVALHDGAVSIRSSPDSGTEVTVTFPEAPARVSVAAE
ncbi:ATP-binding protein [Oceaniradius stylonematis]|uniref:sensor histidine kinase n=1 Tax=Oceaniradius stylonematis TaxID=2184161 RepID=UPI003C7C1D75